jgi:anti-sigma B factor antagonist
MEMSISVIPPGIRIIALTGRMDIPGSQEIDLKFSVEVAFDQSPLILDLGGVEFMASIGIGMIVAAAKVVQRRKGKFCLLNPRPVVLLTLERTQIQTVVPIFFAQEEAIRNLTA